MSTIPIMTIIMDDYNPTQGYNYDNNAYSNSDDYYYYEDLDLDVKVPW